MPVHRRTVILLLALPIVLTAGTIPAAAASFDLLLKGSWVYADLAVLADGGLLEGFHSAQELAEVYPLTRYEAALLIGDLLMPAAQAGSQAGISADTLMWRMLESKGGDPSVQLSSEVVAQTRRASEAASRALAKLALEFAAELHTLGVTDGDSQESLFTLIARGGPPSYSGSKDSGPNDSKAIAQLGAARLVSGLSGASWGKNGFTLSDELMVEIVPIRTSPFVEVDEMVGRRNPAPPWAGLAKASPADTAAPVEEAYSPIEVSALFEQLDEEERHMLQAALEPSDQRADDGAAADEASLKLAANMTEGRPTGLLTSYFLSRVSND